LREPPTALVRAGVVIATRAQDVGDEAWQRTALALATLAPGALLARAALVPVAVLDGAGAPLALPPGTPVICLSGIAGPKDFARAARAFGLDVRGEVAGKDHARFGRLEWWQAERQARREGARILVTAKDAVRLDATTRARVLVLAVEFSFRDGEGAVAQRMVDLAKGAAG